MVEEIRTLYPKKMKASIIIPTYNRSDVIIRSLETWTTQTLCSDDFEVIVVDNNSTDNSATLIKDFIGNRSNFHYLKELKAGSTNARHAGAKLAQSELLIFADDDGLFNESCIEEILKVYQNNQSVDAVAGKIDIAWDTTPPEWIAPYEFMLGKLNYGNKVLTGTHLYLNGGLFSIKKSVFKELGGFNPDLVGDYLVGDGDTGLVIKLHQQKRLIGWTPYAIMQHLQFASKQGTVKDMGRRFYNVGISSSYGLFRINNFKWNVPVFKYIFNSILYLLKKHVEFLIFAKDKRKTYFSMMQRKGELAFFWNLRKVEIRNEIMF
jgi:glycosyltransferase involved in cell wall biosynthesis